MARIPGTTFHDEDPPPLPADVYKFLLEHPEEVQHVRHRMADAEEKRTRPAREAAERERRAKLPLKQCPGLLGGDCTNMTPGGYICDDCNAEFASDPDAYK
jgi:hypothetical protein